MCENVFEFHLPMVVNDGLDVLDDTKDNDIDIRLHVHFLCLAFGSIMLGIST